MSLQKDLQKDLFRDKKQQELIYLWKTKKNKSGQICNGTICAVGGFGKTAMVIEHVFKPIQEKLDLSNYETAFLIVVPKTDLVNQWTQRCNDAGIKKFLVVTVQSFIKSNSLFSCKLVVYDEVHRYYGQKFRRCFSDLIVYSEWKLGLSGSLTPELRNFLAMKGLPVIAEVTQEEALRNGWIANYKEYNLPVYMDYESSVKLQELQKEYDKKLRFLSTDKPDWNVVEKVLNRKIIGVQKDEKGNELYYKTGKRRGQKRYIYKYEYAEELAKIKKQEIGVVIKTAIRLRLIIQERKKIIYNHPKKIETVKKLLQLFPDKKTVTFSMENAFVDKLVKECGGIALHGGVGNKKLQNKILSDFMTCKSCLLHTCFKLSEGTDIPNLELGINISYFSTWVSNSQKMWRVTRKEGDKKPIFINLYLKYHQKISGITQEEIWLINQQKHRKERVEWLTSVNDLNDIVNE